MRTFYSKLANGTIKRSKRKRGNIVQEKTPLYTRLEEFINNKPISFHVPGHKNGLLMQKQPFFKNVWNYDVTELSGLDDLHSASGVILEAEILLSELYQTKRSYFLVNGSTVGNLAMIMSTVEEGDQILVQRNSHKSIMNGIKLAKGRPILLNPSYDSKWKVEGTVSCETIIEAIQKYPKAKVLILTSPNYYGMVGELGKIIEMAHKHNLTVLVDEAHGAHFIGSSKFPVSAVRLGADIVVQSAHKTLPALTMGSYLHFNTNKVSMNKLQTYLGILQSSSPSYVILASLDLARSYLGTYKEEDSAYLIAEAAKFKERLSSLKQLEVMEYNGQAGDPLKLTIQSRCELSGFELQNKLEEAGIYCEMADLHNVLLVLPLLKSQMEYPFEAAFKKIKTAVSSFTPRLLPAEEDKGAPINLYTNIVELKLNDLEQINHAKQEVKLEDSLHMINAEPIIPYPPGIPLLMPGEEITNLHIQKLKVLVGSGCRFQGNSSIYKDKITVFIKN